ncbi:unnamed protein product, partial [Ectocarpus sp. 4 AP-2014]
VRFVFGPLPAAFSLAVVCFFCRFSVRTNVVCVPAVHAREDHCCWSSRRRRNGLYLEPLFCCSSLVRISKIFLFVLCSCGGGGVLSPSNPPFRHYCGLTLFTTAPNLPRKRV